MYPGQTYNFEHRGCSFRAYVTADEHRGAPWTLYDCYGVVSGWVRRPKKPGEVILSSDGGSYRYYDVPSSIEKAARDGWGLGDEDLAKLEANLGRKPTKAEVRAQAVKLDFECLYGWCHDQWCYVGVSVVLLTDDGEPIGDKYQAACWGIESDSDDYIKTEVCPDLADQALEEARAFAERVTKVLSQLNPATE